jgi:hypothetical protein
MKEKDFQTTFSHWLKQVWKKTGAFELKIVHGDSLPFSDVQDHQIAALEAVRWSTLVYKIPDVGYQNPFDCFAMTEQPAYVVVYYETKRFFCLIDIDTFTLERSRSKRKSLTSGRAREIATIVV